MSNLFARLAERIRGKEIATARNYDAMIRQIAGGVIPKTEEVEETLSQAGKTVAQLEADVNRILDRKQLVQAIESRARFKAELAQTKEKIMDSARILQAAEAKHVEAVAPLRERVTQLEAEIFATRGCEAELLATAPPELIEQRNAIAKRRGELLKLQTMRLEAIDGGVRHERHLDGVLRQNEGHAEATKQTEAKVAENDAYLAARREELAIIDDELDGLQREDDALAARQMLP